MTNPQTRTNPADLDETGEIYETKPVRGEPSWFFRNADGFDQTDLADRYRRMRPAPPVGQDLGYRDLISARQSEEARGFQRRLSATLAEGQSPQRRAVTRRPEPKGGLSLGRTHVLAAIAAAVTGAAVGYGASQADYIRSAAIGLSAAVSEARPHVAMAAATGRAPPVTVIAKKPILTATLDVADARGTLNSYIPLALRAEPGLQNQHLIVKIDGLPDEAYLTAGVKRPDKGWQLSPADLKGLRLVVPRYSKPSFKMEVTALEAKSGELMTPAMEMTVVIDGQRQAIIPAAAPAALSEVPASTNAASAIPMPTSTIPADLPATGEAAGLLAKGDQLFKAGDLATARRFYEQAYVKGAPAGALGVARTYDPAVFEEFGVQGLKADQSQARQWYNRAASAGSAEARTALDQLMAQAR